MGKATIARTLKNTGSDLILQVQDVARFFDVSPPWYQRLMRMDRTARTLHAVDGVDFDVPRGKTVGLVGESGCGKSTLARVVAGLYAPSRGTVRFDGIDITADQSVFDNLEVRARIQMVFQDPYASLNPRWRVGSIVAEPFVVHQPELSRSKRDQRVAELLETVGLGPEAAEKFPHQFSGGQRQRISLARALATNPELLICDEPTSALDVSVQAQILNLMRGLQEELGLTYLFISHDLAVIRFVSDFVGVMYLGQLVEWNTTDAIFAAPSHPYTRKLLASVPDLDGPQGQREAIAGEVASPIDRPDGCHFHPRCPFANARCKTEMPMMIPGGRGFVRCHAIEEERISATSDKTPDSAKRS